MARPYRTPYYSSLLYASRVPFTVVLSTLFGVLLVGVGAQSCVPTACTTCTGVNYACCLTVEEEAGNGTQVGSVSQLLPPESSDPSQYTFTLFGSGAMPFAIDAEGRITTTQKIDREQPGAECLCKAVSVSAVLEQTQAETLYNIAVEIEDINDNVPTFDSSNFSIDIDESSADMDVLCGGTGFPRAIDLDASSNGEITYTVVGGDTSYFTITSGPCLHTIREVDRENTTSLFVVINATDSGSPSLASTVTINLTIRDICDNTPTFDQVSPLVILIPENQPNNSVVRTLEAVDSDEGTNGAVEYSIAETGPLVPFQINSVTGDLMLTGELDLESGNRDFSFMVLAVDGCQKPTTGTLQVNIKVTDVNEPAAISHTPSDPEISLVENTRVSGHFLRIDVVDLDSTPENQGFEVSFISGGQYFQQISFTSVVFIDQYSEIDRETESKVDLHIVIIQTGTPSLNHSINVTINVLDVNDNLPELNETHFQILENNAPFKKLAELASVAFDQDYGLNGTIESYELISVTSYPNDIDLTSEFSSKNEDTNGNGIIVAPRALNREVDGPYLNITVRLTDGGGKSVNRSITVEILDENDEHPQFNQTSYDYILMENLPSGSYVGTVTATDADKGENGSIVYSFQDTTNQFAINNLTGEITSLEELDREENSNYMLSVMARDMGVDPLSADGPVMVMITVGDANDNTPVFDLTQTKTTLTVPENARVGERVGVIVATDDDIDDNAVINYRFEPDSELPFNIHVSSGVISVSSSFTGLIGVINVTVIAFNPMGTASEPSKLDISITVVPPESGGDSPETSVLVGVAVGVVMVFIVVVAAAITCFLCWFRRRNRVGKMRFSSGSPTSMNNEVKPRKSSIKPPSSGEQSSGVPASRRVQFQKRVEVCYDSKHAGAGDALYKVESDLLAISDGESPQVLPKHTNGTIVAGDGRSNGVPPQYYAQQRSPFVLREVPNAELELSESTTDEPANFCDGNSDEDSAYSDDDASNINAQIPRFEDRVPSLGTAMRFPNPIPHPTHYQHTPSPPHPIPHYDQHHHSGSLTLTPPQSHHSHSLSSHASTPPVHQITSTSPSHLHSHHRLPLPHVHAHSSLSHSHNGHYPSVMPGALSGGDGFPPPLSSSLLMQQPPYAASFTSDFDSYTYESSDLDEELKFHPDTKPDFISLTATDVYSYDEETDQL